MTKRSVVWRGVACGLVAQLALSACSKQPGGQVVAVINNEEITQQELRAEAQLAQVPPSQDIQAVAPALVERVIERNLLAGYARDQGLDRGPEYVVRRRQLEQTLLATLAIRKLSGTPPKPSPAEVQKFIADRPTIFARRERLTLDQIRFAETVDKARIQALTKLGTIDAIEAKLRADGTRYARSRPVLDTATIAPQIAQQIVALPIGTIFDLTASGGTFMSAITARAPVAGSPESWIAPATEGVKRDKVTVTVQQAVAKLRKSAKISYDPAIKPAATPR